MPYIGNTAADRFVASKAASVYSGDGSTTAFTLEHSVGADEDILVSVDGVIQEPSVAYAVSSGTTLTFTAAPSTNSGNNIFVYYLFKTVATIDHPATSALSATSGTFSTTLDVTGDATFDTSTLKVDSTNNRVGILEASPAAPLHIETGTTTDIMRFGNSGRWGFQRANSDSRYLSLSRAMNGTSSAVMVVDGDNGAITKPLQPAFLATKNGTQQSNIPINASTTILFQTEVFDQNADFASNTFTAPVAGRYKLAVNLCLLNLDQDTSYITINIKTSNRGYIQIYDPDIFDQDANYFSVAHSVLADMDANDTAFIEIFMPNDGATQMNIEGNAQYSYFSGFLAC